MTFPASPVAEECGVAAYGVVRAASADMAALRKKPGPPGKTAFPASLLKHADEQTVAGLAAVMHAIHDFGLSEQSFAEWGVLGAPRFPGRLAAAAAVEAYRQEGAIGVSPHIIPHRCTHSLSGTISLALEMHGPNHGVGAGEGAVVEGMLAALALLKEEGPPGAWLVLTEWDPEPLPSDSSPRAMQPLCHAVALALTPEPRGGGLRLRLSFGAPAATAAPTVGNLADYLTKRERGLPWRCALDWGGVLEIGEEGTSAALENVIAGELS